MNKILQEFFLTLKIDFEFFYACIHFFISLPRKGLRWLYLRLWLYLRHRGWPTANVCNTACIYRSYPVRPFKTPIPRALTTSAPYDNIYCSWQHLPLMTTSIAADNISAPYMITSIAICTWQHQLQPRTSAPYMTTSILQLTTSYI